VIRSERFIYDLAKLFLLSAQAMQQLAIDLVGVRPAGCAAG
jgi:hypothetical protein